MGRKSAIGAAHTQNPTLCSDRRMNRPVSNTEDVSAVPLHDWPESRDPGVERDFSTLELPPEALRESPKNGLSWVDLTDKKTGVSCCYEQQHWLFPAQKFICLILHLRNKETEKGWPGVRPRTHLNWWRAHLFPWFKAFSTREHTTRININSISQELFSFSTWNCGFSTKWALISDLKYPIKYNLEYINFSIKYCFCITRKCEGHVLFCIHRPLAA